MTTVFWLLKDTTLCVKDEYFYRPLGGGIEFGERGKDTICRELIEELGLEVDEVSFRCLGAVENIFIFIGNRGHEIVLVDDGALKEPSAYAQVELWGKEANGEDIRAAWKDFHEFSLGRCILYPDGLLESQRLVPVSFFSYPAL